MAERSLIPTFKLADISNFYKDKLAQLGVQVWDRVNSTRLKEKLLAHIPGLMAHKKGKLPVLSLIFSQKIIVLLWHKSSKYGK